MNIDCAPPQSPISYKIEIANGSLTRQAPYLRTLSRKCVIITDDLVAPLYGEQLLKSLSSEGLEAYLFSFPHGEMHKTRAMKEQLENRMLEHHLSRDTCIIALGGGVATDLVGYVAATYCRGLPLVIMPTSLLGMVDAAIGGKVGVNVPEGKNMIGCIYQPRKVVIDPSVLQSLSKKELACGVVEMIKHGLIADPKVFEYLETHADSLMALDSAVIEKAIFDSCCIKKTIVEQDERENGMRRLLNFGHTIGHALEKVTDYSLLHGEAVAIGILVESYLSMHCEGLSRSDFDRTKALLMKYGLPLQLPETVSVEQILAAMTMDKKAAQSKPRFVLISAIGKSVAYDGHFCTIVEESTVKQALDWMQNDLCHH